MDHCSSIILILAKLLLIAFVLLSSGALIFWIYVERKGILFQIRYWSDEKKQLMIITYFYLVCSYLFSILSATYIFSSPFLLEKMTLYPKEVIFITLIMMATLTALLEYIPYNDKDSVYKLICWLLHSIIMGPSFAYFGYFICIESTLKTCFALSLATLISFTAPEDFYIDLKPFVEKLYIGVTISSFLCFLFNPPVNAISLLLLASNLCGGILLYFCIFITNTQYMLGQLSETCYDPVYTAAVMYLSTLNLMLRIAMFYVAELTDITINDDKFSSNNKRNVSSFA
ncbi:hypothetical protein O3M35_002741 [Rhynocoris fuscipes]|uniref:Uncharacterized protein n=1 Tax=Rhynocoris fuscipes TaxID=488301 RepID=A0AAW1CQH5_9HEMI